MADHTLGRNPNRLNRDRSRLRPRCGSRAEVAQTSGEIAVSAPLLTLREKHPLATRWMHWINFPLLALMIWSGLMIYWADSERREFAPA